MSVDIPPNYDEPIIIVGAGVFGLSTALHLAKRGYQNITVFDRHPYHESKYSYFEGADSASADINKIIRSAYGGVDIYQALSLEAIDHWNEWNDRIQRGQNLPPGFTRNDKVFIPNGNLSMTDAPEISEFDRATIRSMEDSGHSDSQLDVCKPHDRSVATKKGFEFAMDPFGRQRRSQTYSAVLDTTGGTAVADKACRFAMHEARCLGVRFVLDGLRGALKSFLYSSHSENRVIGITTVDGGEHHARLTIMACGAWTSSIVPELDGLCEATAGTVAFIKIPRTSPLWDRFAPERFPSWQWNMRHGAQGGLYGFARSEEGWLKIGYRGVKYTNPIDQSDGIERSVPVTRWTSDKPGGNKLTSAPAQALEVINRFMKEYLPELAEASLGISYTRVCWYNDSFDNHLVIDRIPAVHGAMVATGDSGHAFKYLPIIGDRIVDIIEGKNLENSSIRAWKWRSLEGNEPKNSLMEGSSGPRSLGHLPLVPDENLRNITKARL